MNGLRAVKVSSLNAMEKNRGDAMPTLHYARFIRRLTQQDLSVLTGMTQSTISAFERGYRLPDTEQRQKLSAALDIPADDLVFELLTPEEIKAKSS